MHSPLPQCLPIQHSSDVAAARRAARTCAEAAGFGAIPAEEIALVMTELATNLIKHASGGTLTLTALSDAERAGLEIESRDDGPGIADVGEALGDRFSTSGSRGTGMGAINRLMDEMKIISPSGKGTRIVCRKWVRAESPSNLPCPLAIGVATRPRQTGAENGDAFVVKHWGQSLLVGVIDGLGHGSPAHSAAGAARRYVESHFDQPPGQIFLGVGRACRATRGVVMALARFDWGVSQLTFASVGNIESRVFPVSAAYKFIVRRGVLGLNAPAAVVTELPWPAGHLLVLHSDGLRSHWAWKDFPDLTTQPVTVLAQEFLRLQAREEDDATVLVVRSVLP